MVDDRMNFSISKCGRNKEVENSSTIIILNENTIMIEIHDKSRSQSSKIFREIKLVTKILIEFSHSL